MTLPQLILLISMGALALFNYLRYRDVLYPAFIQSSVWTVVLLFYVLNQKSLLPLSLLTYAVIGSGIVLFSTGSFLGTYCHNVPQVTLPEITFAQKDWYHRLLFWLPVLGLAPFLGKAYLMGQTGPFDNFYMNLRTAVTLDEQDPGGAFGPLAYLVTISFVSVTLQTLFATYRTHRLRFAVSIAVYLTYAAFFAGRSLFFSLLVVLSGILLLTRRVSARAVLLTGAVVFLAIFISIGLALGKAGSDHTTLSDSIQSIYDVVVIYTVAPLPALDLHLRSFDEWEWGINLLRTPLSVLSALGFDVPRKPITQAYEFVPIPINVYTYYRTYYDDFSLYGVLLAPLFIGFLHGFLYRKATSGHLLFMVLYAMSLSPLILQFFTNGYEALSIWVQNVILLFLYFYRIRLLPPEQDRSTAMLQPA